MCRWRRSRKYNDSEPMTLVGGNDIFPQNKNNKYAYANVYNNSNWYERWWYKPIVGVFLFMLISSSGVKVVESYTSEVEQA